MWCSRCLPDGRSSYRRGKEIYWRQVIAYHVYRKAGSATWYYIYYSVPTGSYVLDSPWKNFEKIFKTVWANNANAMSFAYAGTGALKVDFTKTG